MMSPEFSPVEQASNPIRKGLAGHPSNSHAQLAWQVVTATGSSQVFFCFFFFLWLFFVFFFVFVFVFVFFFFETGF